jgi:hypothetical protein
MQLVRHTDRPIERTQRGAYNQGTSTDITVSPVLRVKGPSPRHLRDADRELAANGRQLTKRVHLDGEGEEVTLKMLSRSGSGLLCSPDRESSYHEYWPFREHVCRACSTGSPGGTRTVQGNRAASTGFRALKPVASGSMWLLAASGIGRLSPLYILPSGPPRRWPGSCRAR